MIFAKELAFSLPSEIRKLVFVEVKVEKEKN
jgi:hypothetical protein